MLDLIISTKECTSLRTKLQSNAKPEKSKSTRKYDFPSDALKNLPTG
jgi:hypothetical protein